VPIDEAIDVSEWADRPDRSSIPALSCAEPMRSISGDPRREDQAIWTVTAPDRSL
jgi:hypothetical protein